MSQVKEAEFVPEELLLEAPCQDLFESVRAFNQYNQVLYSLWDELRSNDELITRDELSTIVTKINGAEVMKRLRMLIPITDLRDAGSFFTGDDLADIAVESIEVPIGLASKVLDPTCGAGNLLVACSKKLPISESLTETIRQWGKILAGWDIFPEFVETTKLRIILEAINRGCCLRGSNLEELKGLLPHVRCTNALIEKNAYGVFSHIIVNPPFGRIQAPKSCTWSNGFTNSAGVFIEHIVSNLKIGVCVVAILPEVLRCGTRYSAWREILDSKINHNLHLAGRFDRKTNVDVFLLCGVVRDLALGGGEQGWAGQQDESSRVGDKFSISVGPVVPFRDPEEGIRVPYIYPRILPKWEEVDSFSEYRCFSGRVVAPPFVVIRRTSSPSDRERAIATLIKGKARVAVENHLIIAEPKDGSLESCRKLMRILGDRRTNDFLNERIRCRHLTVGSVKETPWNEDI